MKFIIHEDLELYTSHGPLIVKKIFEVFETNSLQDDFLVAGFKYNSEYASKITNMKMIYSNIGKIVKLTGQGIHDVDIIVYPNQKFMDIAGKTISVENAKPGDMFVSLNGMIQVEYIGEKEFEEARIFYIIEVENEKMNNLFCNNVIFLCHEAGENNNSFFTE